MKKFIALLVGSFCSCSIAYAKPTDGVLFSCSKVVAVPNGVPSQPIMVGGILPVSGTNRLGVIYKTSAGQFGILNDAELNFRAAEGDNLESRYGAKRLVVQDSAFKVNVDFESRTLAVRIPVSVSIDGVLRNREIFLSSIPGTFLFYRNDENGRSANFKAVFTGLDPADGSKQMPDELVSCSLNQNLN